MISALIPSHHARGRALRRCLASLWRQTRRPDEVLVVLDGGSEADAAALGRAWNSRFGDRLRVWTQPASGYLPARRTLVDRSRGRWLLSLNDDIELAPGCVAAHAEAHEAAPGETLVVTGPCLQLAASDAERVSPGRPADLLDRLVAETGLVFFDAAAAAAAGELTHRHVYGLNLSAPADAVRAVGGFADFPNTYGYDDLQLARKLERHAGARVRFAHGAAVSHRHRYDTDALFAREEALGRAAWRYAHADPAFTQELFHRDLRDAAELAYLRTAVDREAVDARRNLEAFAGICRQPADALPANSALLAALPGFWVPGKRWLWRRGVLSAAGA